MKVFLEPTGLHSTAMKRVSAALTKAALDFPSIKIVKRPDDADLQVLHIVQWDDRYKNGWERPFVPIQYCIHSALGGTFERWMGLWEKALMVWSYYDIYAMLEALPYAPHARWNISYLPKDNFYHAPLGVDNAFLCQRPALKRDLVITSGYVTGYPGEAIEEVWNAAERAGLAGVHIGPANLEGSTRKLPENWKAESGITDEQLAAYYRRALYVSGLRYVEGFELPAAEGLVCGARPILFDQPSQHRWYGASGVYLQEREVEQQLDALFASPYNPVSSCEQAAAVATFNWEDICHGFWKRLA